MQFKTQVCSAEHTLLQDAIRQESSYYQRHIEDLKRHPNRRKDLTISLDWFIDDYETNGFKYNLYLLETRESISSGLPGCHIPQVLIDENVQDMIVYLAAQAGGSWLTKLIKSIYTNNKHITSISLFYLEKQPLLLGLKQ